MGENENDVRARRLSETLGFRVTIRNGWIVLPSRGGVVTSEMVRQIQDEIDNEEVERASAIARGKYP